MIGSALLGTASKGMAVRCSLTTSGWWSLESWVCFPPPHLPAVTGGPLDMGRFLCENVHKRDVRLGVKPQ